MAEEASVTSWVGHRIVGAAYWDPVQGREWGDHWSLLLTLDNGQTFQIGSWGYDASGFSAELVDLHAGVEKAKAYARDAHYSKAVH